MEGMNKSHKLAALFPAQFGINSFKFKGKGYHIYIYIGTYIWQVRRSKKCKGQSSKNGKGRAVVLLHQELLVPACTRECIGCCHRMKQLTEGRNQLQWCSGKEEYWSSKLFTCS